jgi:zinc protease
VIVGDIQTEDARKLIETYFGDIPAQPLPKRPDLSEPADFKPVKQVYKDKLAQVPAVIIGYPGPKRRSPDYYALHMVDAILTAGDSSRFRMDLVKGKESILQYEAELGWPFASARDYRDPEPYAMFIVHKPNFTGDQIVGQIQDEIARLQNAPVDAKELERVKTQVRAGAIKEMQSSQSRAEALAQFQLADGDPNLINTELDRILAVTPAQIQAAAKKYLTADKRAVLEIQPAPEQAGKEDK